MLNSYIFYKQTTGQTIGFSDFRLRLVRGIIEMYGESTTSTDRSSTRDNPVRLTVRHFPSLIPPASSKQNFQRKYIVCANTTWRSKKKSDSRYERSECNVALCFSDCFRGYHTLKYFWIFLFKLIQVHMLWETSEKISFLLKVTPSDGLIVFQYISLSCIVFDCHNPSPWKNDSTTWN